jgi:ATP-dependent Zn protease
MPGLRARVLLIAFALIALAIPAQAQAAKQVSYPELLQQVKAGALIRAVINRKRSAIEIKFRDLSEWEAIYPPGAQHELQRILRGRHVRVIFASRRKAKAKPHSVHHHLRYIAAGILAALVLIGAGWFFIARRREHPPSPAADSPPDAHAEGG